MLVKVFKKDSGQKEFLITLIMDFRIPFNLEVRAPE